MAQSWLLSACPEARDQYPLKGVPTIVLFLGKSTLKITLSNRHSLRG